MSRPLNFARDGSNDPEFGDGHADDAGDRTPVWVTPQIETIVERGVTIATDHPDPPCQCRRRVCDHRSVDRGRVGGVERDRSRRATRVRECSGLRLFERRYIGARTEQLVYQQLNELNSDQVLYRRSESVGPILAESRQGKTGVRDIWRTTSRSRCFLTICHGQLRRCRRQSSSLRYASPPRFRMRRTYSVCPLRSARQPSRTEPPRGFCCGAP
jgi:hypothetical protein